MHKLPKPGGVEGNLTPGPPIETEVFLSIGVHGHTYIRPDVADWIEAIESVDAFEHAWVDFIELEGELDGLPATEYSFSGSVEVNGVALSERYLPDEAITSVDPDDPAATDEEPEIEDGDE